MMFGASHAAQASGVITIVGSITDTTCRIGGGDPPHHLLVRLPKISRSALPAVNDVAGTTRFTIALSDCPESLNGQNLSAYFEHGPTTDFLTDNLLTYRPAAEVTAAATAIPTSAGTLNAPVQIKITNVSDGSQVLLGKAQPDQNAAGFRVVPTVTGAGGNNYGTNLHYFASYVRTATGAITAGNLVSYVRYSIVYP